LQRNGKNEVEWRDSNVSEFNAQSSGSSVASPTYFAICAVRGSRQLCKHMLCREGFVTRTVERKANSWSRLRIFKNYAWPLVRAGVRIAAAMFAPC